MGQHILPGNPPIAVDLKRSPRARRLSLRVSRLDGRVTLTMPLRLAEREGLAFVADREGWLRKHLSGRPADLRPGFGTAIPFEGREVVLTPGPVRAPTLVGGELLLPPDPAKVTARTLAFLKSRARDALASACDRHSATLGRPYGRLTLRDTRSRWGSCTTKGDLMFSWRLIMAPAEVLDYVAAHEVAHLAQMNHSPAYWATCARLYPGYKEARRWLKQHGETLHRLQFGD
jgi:predicted metal-dependent hydrolase